MLLDSGESTTTLACSCCTMQQSLFLSHMPMSPDPSLTLLHYYFLVFFSSSFPFLIQISFHAHLALCANTIVCAPLACFPIFHTTLINCPLKPPPIHVYPSIFFTAVIFDTLDIITKLRVSKSLLCRKLYICTYLFYSGQRFRHSLFNLGCRNWKTAMSVSILKLQTFPYANHGNQTCIIDMSESNVFIYMMNTMHSRVKTYHDFTHLR